MVMGVSVVSRLIQQELKPSAVSGLETTAQVCYVLYWEPQDLLCVHLLTINHLFEDILRLFLCSLSSCPPLVSSSSS